MKFHDVHKKIADAVKILIDKIEPTGVWMRLGVDGIIVGNLCEYAINKKSKYRASFDTAVQVSSKTDQDDVNRILEALMRGPQLSKPVYGIDMRTKTGSLGKKLKNYVNDLASSVPNIDFKYTVLFDPFDKADISASREELTDEERPMWFNAPSQNPIRFVNGMWRYQTSGMEIDKLNHVKEIKKLI